MASFLTVFCCGLIAVVLVNLRHSLFLRNRLSICGVNVWSNMLENQLLVSGRQHAAGGGGGPMVQVSHRAKMMPAIDY